MTAPVVITQKELAARTATLAALDPRSVQAVLRALTQVIGEQCRDQGKDIRVSGLGRFRARDTKARQVRNPRTGELQPVPARRRIVFKASSGLVRTL